MGTAMALPKDHWTEDLDKRSIAKVARPLIIRSDSQTAIHKITDMQRTGWAANTDLLHIAYVSKLYNLANIPIGICWIKGHSGNEGNERADKSAKEARKKDPINPSFDYFNIIAKDKELRKKARC